MTLEEDLDALLDAPDTFSAAQAMAVIAKHTKHIRNWPKFLRRLAGYLEARPVPVEISAREIRKLIEGTDDPT